MQYIFNVNKEDVAEQYILCGCSADNRSSKFLEECYKVREIDKEDYNLIENAVNDIFLFGSHQSLYIMCARNYDDMILYLQEVQDVLRTQPMTFLDDQKRNEIYLEINRKMLNYLSSFRTFVDHYATRLKRQDQEDMRDYHAFKDATTYFFDNSFAYRFCYKLRNYAQHVGLPISISDILFLPFLDQDDSQSVSQSIYTIHLLFNPAQLLINYQDWGSIITADLEKQEQVLSAIKIMHELQGCLHKINSLCLLIDLNTVYKSWNTLINYAYEVFEKYGRIQPVVTVFTRTSDGPTFETLERVIWFPMTELSRIHSLRAAHMQDERPNPTNQ